jgi:NAD(P)H-quinone oxidoreductase subunit 5
VHPVGQSLLPLLIPLLYGAAALLTRPVGPDRRWALARLVSTGGLVSALGLAGMVALAGPVVTRIGALGVLRLDGLAAVMLLLVTGLASAILGYSRRYLDGEPGQSRYLQWFHATIAAATLLVTSGDLLLIALAWTGSSLALHQLLTFHPHQPEAQVAAHKKFLLSRLADLCMAAAVALLAWGVGTTDINALIAASAGADPLPRSTTLAGFLIVGAVLLRSAQLPFHGWLIQVMEAPTPVSALLHAGIVNIGGFVLIRLGGLMPLLPGPQLLLIIVGSLTAVLAALVMTTRVSIKVALAWSTCAQMGFMLVECGLGAYPLALLHLAAHGLYKAHAFLGSGSTVSKTLRRGLAHAAGTPTVLQWIVALLAAIALVSGAGILLGLDPASEPSLWAIGTIVALALSPVLTRGMTIGTARGWLASTLVASAVLLLYAAWHAAFLGIVAPATAVPPLGVAWAIVAFASLWAVQVAITTRPFGAVARRLYPVCFAGFYLDAIFTRMTFLVWPPAVSRPMREAA